MREPGKPLIPREETQAQKEARQARNRRKRARRSQLALVASEPAPWVDHHRATFRKPKRHRQRLNALRREGHVSKKKARKMGWAKSVFVD